MTKILHQFNDYLIYIKFWNAMLINNGNIWFTNFGVTNYIIKIYITTRGYYNCNIEVSRICPLAYDYFICNGGYPQLR